MEQEECFALAFLYSSLLRNVPVGSPQIPSMLQALPGVPTRPAVTGTLQAREGGSSSLSSAALQAAGQSGLTALWDAQLFEAPSRETPPAKMLTPATPLCQPIAPAASRSCDVHHMSYMCIVSQPDF